jgi:hypothetical protein
MTIIDNLSSIFTETARKFRAQESAVAAVVTRVPDRFPAVSNPMSVPWAQESLVATSIPRVPAGLKLAPLVTKHGRRFSDAYSLLHGEVSPGLSRSPRTLFSPPRLRALSDPSARLLNIAEQAMVMRAIRCCKRNGYAIDRFLSGFGARLLKPENLSRLMRDSADIKVQVLTEIHELMGTNPYHNDRHAAQIMTDTLRLLALFFTFSPIRFSKEEKVAAMFLMPLIMVCHDRIQGQRLLGDNERESAQYCYDQIKKFAKNDEERAALKALIFQVTIDGTLLLGRFGSMKAVHTCKGRAMNRGSKIAALMTSAASQCDVFRASLKHVQLACFSKLSGCEGAPVLAGYADSELGLLWYLIGQSVRVNAEFCLALKLAMGSDSTINLENLGPKGKDLLTMVLDDLTTGFHAFLNSSAGVPDIMDRLAFDPDAWIKVRQLANDLKEYVSLMTPAQKSRLRLFMLEAASTMLQFYARADATTRYTVVVTDTPQEAMDLAAHDAFVQIFIDYTKAASPFL